MGGGSAAGWRVVGGDEAAPGLARFCFSARASPSTVMEDWQAARAASSASLASGRAAGTGAAAGAGACDRAWSREGVGGCADGSAAICAGCTGGASTCPWAGTCCGAGGSHRASARGTRGQASAPGSRACCSGSGAAWSCLPAGSPLASGRGWGGGWPALSAARLAARRCAALGTPRCCSPRGEPPCCLTPASQRICCAGNEETVIPSAPTYDLEAPATGRRLHQLLVQQRHRQPCGIGGVGAMRRRH